MDQQAACYYRVSSEEQAKEGISLDAQEARLQAYCTLMGLVPVAMIRETGISGARRLADRPGGAELLRLIRLKQVQHVVALKLDRLFRDTEDCQHQTKAWDRSDVALHLVDMGGQTLNTASAMGRMFLTMAAGVAELERNLVAERTAAAIHYKQAQLEYIGGDTPYGWQVAADGVHVEPQAAEQAVIREALRLKEQGLSLRRIGQELANKGLLPRQGGGWHPQSVKVSARGGGCFAVHREDRAAHTGSSCGDEAHSQLSLK